MSTALDYVRYSCGIAGEEVAERVDALEAMCDRHADELKVAFEAGKKEGWEACETCHGIVGGVHQLDEAANKCAILGINTEWCNESQRVVCSARGHYWSASFSDHNNDREAAWRYAATQVAAKIGGMK